jgi:hypothetical protein
MNKMNKIAAAAVLALTLFPRPTLAQVYDGSDVEGIEVIVKKLQDKADWRAAAEKRIDAIRKSDLSIQVVGADGAPLEGANVRVTLTKHAFTFGGVIMANTFEKSEPLIKDFFNQLGFGIGLKFKQKERMAE